MDISDDYIELKEQIKKKYERRYNNMYIKSPLNYTGGKYKLLPQIMSSFPSEGCNTFVDLFTGGLNVGVNVNAKTIYANDRISYL